LKFDSRLVALGFLFLLLASYTYMASAEEWVIITSPSDGSGFDEETVTLYAQISNLSMPLPFLKYSYDPDEAVPMTSWGNNIYVHNINFSQFPNGSWSILVFSGDYTDSINVSITHTIDPIPTPTPEPTPSPLKNLSVSGIEDEKTYDNTSLFLLVTDADGQQPVHFPVWKIWHKNRIVNSGTGYYSGRCNIEWVDDFGKQLEDGAYLIQILADQYVTQEFIAYLKRPEPPEKETTKLTIFGLDTKLTDAISSWITVMDGDENYINDVSVRVSNRDGTTIQSTTTDGNGRVLLDWAKVAPGKYVIDFSKPNYKSKIMDVTVVSSVITPTATASPAPTPVPTPIPIPHQDEGEEEIPQSQPATPKEAKASIWDRIGPFSTLALLGSVCGLVLFPKQAEKLGSRAGEIIKQRGRDIKEIRAHNRICQAIDTSGGIEVQCQNTAAQGSRFCLDHIKKTTPKRLIKRDYPQQWDRDDFDDTDEVDFESDADADADEADVDRDTEDLDLFVRDDVIQWTIDLMASGKPVGDVKTLFEQKYGEMPDNAWFDKIKDYTED
jgi:hypothetical protein